MTNERDEQARETQQQLTALGEDIAAAIERRFGNRASFVLTFVCDQSVVASYLVGGDRPAALLAMRDLLMPGPEVNGEPTSSLIEAELGGDQAWNVGWKPVQALALLRRTNQ